jgi:hypothetical protein
MTLIEVVPSRRWRFLLVLLALVRPDYRPIRSPDDAGRKPTATRADLESALTQAEQIAA